MVKYLFSFCIEGVMIGASYLIPNIPDWLAWTLFGGGLLGIFITGPLLIMEKAGVNFSLHHVQYIPLKKATLKAYEYIRKKAKDKSTLPSVDVIAYDIWRSCPLYGTHQNATFIEPVENLKSSLVPRILNAGANVDAPFKEIFIKRSDFKKYIDARNPKQ